MNAFYFDDRRLRGKLLQFMQKKLFRTDLRKPVETLQFTVTPQESIGKRLCDTFSTSLRKYILEFEVSQKQFLLLNSNDSASSISIGFSRLEQRLETVSCLLKHMDDGKNHILYILFKLHM
jgi:hypothetical protein